MSLITTLVKPDSTLHAVYAKLISQREYHLVTAKNSSIDIYSITEGGLVLIESLPIYGQVESLVSFQPIRKGNTSQTTDWLFFSLTDGTCHVICYSNGKFVAFKSAQLENKDSFGPPTSTLIHKAVIDPTGSFIAIYLTVGYISLFKISKKVTDNITKPASITKGSNSHSLDNIFEKANMIAPLDFVNIENMIFIPGMKVPTLAVIYNQQEGSGRRTHVNSGGFYSINILTVDSSGSKLTSRASWNNIDIAKFHLMIPISEPLGGFILLGGRSFMYCNGSEKLRTGQGSEKLDTKHVLFNDGGADDDYQQFSTCAEIDYNRHLVGTKSGHLYLFHLQAGDDQGSVIRGQLIPVGQTSPATQLLHLSSKYFFASSHSSLSLVFRLEVDGDPYSITIIQELENLAPIVDFNIENDDNGNSAIITCSGGYYGSSLKKIEYAYQVDTLAEVDLSIDNTIKTIWQFDNIVAISYLSQTRLLSMDKSGEFSELNEWKNLKTNVCSLLLGKFVNNIVIQVTTNEVLLPELSMSWSESNNISFASLANNHLAVCADGKSIVIFDSDLTITHYHSYEDFISALSITDDGSYYSVSFWNTSKIFVVDNSPTYNILQTITLEPDSLPRSLYLPNSSSAMTIIVGMADGALFVYDIHKSTLLDKFIIGDEAISLHPFGEHIIAISNQIFLIERQLVSLFGPNKFFTTKMNFEIPVARCNLEDNSPYGPNCFIFANEDGLLKVSKVVDKASYICTQEKSLDGQFIRRVAQNVELGFTAVGTLPAEMTVPPGAPKSSKIQLLESSTFDVIDLFNLNKSETCENILAVSSDLIEFEGFVVGTSLDEGGPNDQSTLSTGIGRFILFSCTQDSRKLTLEHEIELPGSIFKIELMDQKLTAPTIRFLVTVQSRIREVLLNRISDGSFRLELMNETTLQSSTIPLFISSLDEQVVVGELLRKVTLGDYSPSNPLSKVVSCVGGYWQSNVILISSNQVLVADNELNILLLKTADNELDEHSRSYLDVAASYHLGELVNQVRRLENGTSNRWKRIFDSSKEFKKCIQPRAIIGTVSGGLYLYSEIVNDHSLEKNLTITQDNIIANSKSVNAPSGGTEAVSLYHRYRSVSPSEFSGFINGDILKRFSTMPSYDQDRVYNGSNGGEKISLPRMSIKAISDILQIV